MFRKQYWWRIKLKVNLKINAFFQAQIPHILHASFPREHDVRLTVYLSAMWRASTWLWRIPSSTRSLQGQKIDWQCVYERAWVWLVDEWTNETRKYNSKSSNNSALRKARDVFFASARDLIYFKGALQNSNSVKTVVTGGYWSRKISTAAETEADWDDDDLAFRYGLHTHTRFPVAFGCMVTSPFVGQQHHPWWFVMLFCCAH
jgi:hypothetical protein